MIDGPINYETGVNRYAALTKKVGSLQRLSAPDDKILNVEHDRHDLHDKLKALALAEGRTEESVSWDILIAQGSLKEYGVDSPVLRLPLVGIYFSFNVFESVGKGEKPASVSTKWAGEDVGLVTNAQWLLTPEGKDIAWISPWPKQKYDSDKGRIVLEGVEYDSTGDASQIEKWSKSPYFAVVFSETLVSGRGMSYREEHPKLHEVRLERRKRLATDLGLNLLEAWDLNGHEMSGEHKVFGVEVPGGRLEEVALAMRNNPEKYWVTPQELASAA